MNTTAAVPSSYINEPVRLLIVGQTDSDLRTLRSITAETQWEITEARNNVCALASAASRGIGVILLEHDVVAANWIKLLTDLQENPASPRVVVFSRWADEHLWADVLNRGGYDVLPVPFAHDEVLRTSYLAWSSWNEMSRLASSQQHDSSEGGSTVRSSRDYRRPVMTAGDRREISTRRIRVAAG